MQSKRQGLHPFLMDGRPGYSQTQRAEETVLDKENVPKNTRFLNFCARETWPVPLNYPIYARSNAIKVFH